ncbi:MAG: hypothetical protein Q7T50_02605, partial [Candidatus Magasanikbacteria bacterium]|nr:hypothetical protein [Candidatus Magasanikbacteria bacterium]
MEDLSPKSNLNTRFAPTEKPRQVVENSQMHPTKLASQVGFNPVATMNLGNNKIYIRPVKNTQSRAVSPGVVGSSGQITVRGERTISLTTDMHKQLKNNVGRTIEKFVSQKPVVQTAQKYISPEDLKPEHFVKTQGQNLQQTAVLPKPAMVSAKVASINQAAIQRQVFVTPTPTPTPT